MSGSQLQVRLYRDSFNTPWGFRLQGGKDLGQPLSVQRVFSNSPAEGELQRGDWILAIGGREANELTHKQAQDLIKFGGGQIQLVIQRPAPGRVQSTATFKPQRPRAPSLQLSPVSPTMSGSLMNQRGWPGYDPCYNPAFSPKQQYQPFSPSSSHHAPPWAAQQFEPKKVSKLSKLGGGGFDFGVDYATVPRRRHSTQISSSMSHYQTRGHPAKVASLSKLGGGGFDFGVDYCTLPRRPQRQHSQPPASQSTMPAPGTGFTPKKVTLSRLGGGGPEFGADFSTYRPSVTQPVTVRTGPSGQHADMLNRVQESLDSISLSPRTPDYYQPPPFASPSSTPQYIPTGVRLDMEREQEMRNKQVQQQQQQPPFYQQQPSYDAPYTPTFERLEQQGQGEEEEHVLPGTVHERRKAFTNAPRPAAPISSNRPAPRIPKPAPGKSPFTFGLDYSKPRPKTSTVTWKPQPVQRPVNMPPPVEIYQSTTPAWKTDQDETDRPKAPPAWRTTLKSTGVKPWEADLECTPGQQQAPRSAPYQPAASSASFTPQVPAGGGQQDGPNVVHLQYNSPIGLYSKENVQETYAGQTKALAAGPPSPGGTATVQNPPKAGDRDWTQSAVYRMIYEEEHRGKRPPQQQQQHQQQAPPPPPPPPKPQTQPAYQQSFRPLDDEFGTSDF